MWRGVCPRGVGLGRPHGVAGRGVLRSPRSPCDEENAELSSSWAVGGVGFATDGVVQSLAGSMRDAGMKHVQFRNSSFRQGPSSTAPDGDQLHVWTAEHHALAEGCRVQRPEHG